MLGSSKQKKSDKKAQIHILSIPKTEYKLKCIKYKYHIPTISKLLYIKRYGIMKIDNNNVHLEMHTIQVTIVFPS